MSLDVQKVGLPVPLRVLRELGEWAALGFYQGRNLPWPRAFGLAYRRLYEQMAITIPDDVLLLPHEPFPTTRNYTEHRSWHATGLICDFKHHTGLTVNPEIAAEKKVVYPHHADMIDRLVVDLQGRLPYFGGYTHSNPDIRRVISEGFLAMEAELAEELATVQRDAPESEEAHLLLALQDYCAGVHAFHRRTCAAMRAAGPQLAEIADSFAHAFLHPAANFVEGLLAVNFTWMLDGCDSLGRLDQVLGPLFERDLREGILDLAFARRLLDECWKNFERLNGWNIQLCGYTPEGQDGANALTLECIAACKRNRQLRPNAALRITRETPDEILLAALEALATGSGRPALYNDDLYIDTLLKMDLGLTPEDARELGFGGCTETMIGGMSNVGSIEGYLNLAKALELALHDGYDPIAREQAGPHTGHFTDMPSFDDLLQAVKRQIQFTIDSFIAMNRIDLQRRFREGDPKMARTMFTRDCVKRHTSFEAGGARYNWALVTFQGIANLIDSLSAIRQHVYRQGAVNPAELLAALAADFDGYDDLRRRLRNAPTFGNDDAETDELGRELIDYTWRHLTAYETPRGGRYLPCVILFNTYGDAGKQVGATPDGRQAHEVLTDSVGAAQGRDTNGPTALLNSVLKLPLSLAIGTPVLNLRFQRSLMESREGLQGVLALVRAFFARGGMQLQISVVDQHAMKAAQQDPDAHRDLIVRIGGFSAYFTDLPIELQDSVIARTEYVAL